MVLNYMKGELPNFCFGQYGKVTEVWSCNHKVLEMMNMLETQVGQLVGCLMKINEVVASVKTKEQMWRPKRWLSWRISLGPSQGRCRSGYPRLQHP
jgi:hypothetical protein